MNMSYAQWVRAAIARSRGSEQSIISLFDSSVPEPTALLREIIEKAFSTPISDRYVSAFMGGNQFALSAIARRYSVPRAHVMGTAGATSAIALIYRALVRADEHILVEWPGFDMFSELATDRSIAVDHFNRVGERFSLDFESIRNGIRPNTRLIVLSNLHNPTGMPVMRAELEALASIAEPRGIKILVDEVYADYAGALGGVVPAASLSPAFISVSSLTKIFGLSTLRCGWIIAEENIMARIGEAADRAELSVSNLSHAVAALILEAPDAFTRYWQDILAASRPVMEARLARWKSLGLVSGEMPRHGCILFPKLAAIADDAAFAEWLLDRSGVIVAPGTFFGAPGHIRIGFGRDIASLEAGLDALEEGIRTYPARVATHAVHA